MVGNFIAWVLLTAIFVFVTCGLLFWYIPFVYVYD